MKQTFTLLLACLAMMTTNARAEQEKQTAKLESVTIFTNGAQVKRSKTVTLKAGEQTIKTPSQPAKLQLDAWTAHNPESPEPPEYPDNPGKPEKPEYPGSIAPAKAPLLHADGSDLAFITVSLTDAEGTLIPDASDQLTFEVTGAGRFEAACNGDATSLEPFTLPTMRLFSGQLVVIIRSGRQPGDITLKVTDQQRGLSQSITVKAI